ncbi:MAG: acyltransferase family protein [Pseudomonadota bacterium]
MAVEKIYSSHSKYRHDIDGLRAIAVLSVVFFHVFPNWIKSGFIGVDIFFVISGFLISTIIFEKLDNGTFSFTEFYARRVKRIFPALTLVLVACFAFGWFTLFADEYKQLGKHIAGGAVFISNFMLWKESGYFDNVAEAKPLLHLWSLGVEEQFYIIWPILLWFAYKKRFNLLSIGIVIAIASFFLNIQQVKNDAVADFYSPQTRFWELMFGSILAWLILYKPSFSVTNGVTLDRWLSKAIYRDPHTNNGQTLASVISLFAFLLILYGFCEVDEIGFPGKWAIIPVLGAVLIIFAGPKAWINRTILSNKIAVWFGLISFPLYLWHWPLLSFAKIIGGEVLSLNIRITVVIVSVALAWLTYKFVERPIRLSKHGKAKVMVLVLIMSIVGYGGYNTYKLDGLPFRALAKQSKDFDVKNGIEGYAVCDLNELKTKNITLDYCLKSVNHKPNSAIIGDSHAADKFYGLTAVDKKNSWMLIGNSACPPVLGINVEASEKRCEDKFKIIFKYLIENKNIENVVLSFYGNYFKTDAYAADHVKDNFGPNAFKITSSNFHGNRSDLFFDGLNSAIKLLSANGKAVTLIVDVPELPFFPKDCFRNSFKMCEISKAKVLSRQAELRNIIDRLKKSNPTLKTFDPLDLLCNNDTCSYKKDGLIFYRDSHHLSLRGSNFFAERFINF